MHNYKSSKLDQDYKSRSTILKLISKYICSWGIQKTPMTKEGKIVGATAPIWINKNTLYFKINSIIAFICMLLFIACYVFLRYYNENNELSGLSVRDYSRLPPDVSFDEFKTQTAETTSTQTTLTDAYCMYRSFNQLNSSFVLIGAIILFSNFIHNSYLGCYLDYASDFEWSRNILSSCFIWLLIVGITIGEYVYSTNLIKFYNDNYDNNSQKVFNDTSTKCNELFIVNMYGNLIVAIILSLLAIIQIYKLFTIFKELFISKYVEHTARCEDENIIVIT